MDVQLKFDDDVRYHNGEEYVLRTWVNKDKFQEFELEYRDSQDDNSSNNISDVEFEVHINMKDLDTKIIGITKYGFRLPRFMAVSVASKCLSDIRLLR